MLIASWLDFTPPPLIAHTLCANLCMERDKLGRRDNQDDRFTSPVYLPCITACTLPTPPLPSRCSVVDDPTTPRTVQIVIMWTVPLTEYWSYRIGCYGQKKYCL